MNNLYYMDAESLHEMQANIDKAQEGLSMADFVNVRKERSIDEQGIATIDIRGVLREDAPPIHSKIGGTDYKEIRNDIQQVQADGAKAILFTIASPGGTVAGAEETAKMIESLPIPSATFYGGQGCSASYKLGCGSMASVAAPSSNLGNIGTIQVYKDASKAMERLGVVTHVFTNKGAEFKSTMQNGPLSKEQEAFMQESINDAGESFKQHVLSNRPEIDHEVFKAGWYKGDKAVELGLVDQIGTLEDAKQILRATMSA
jgi:protease-4